MNFDLISDLHIEFWKENQQVNWEGLSTSLIAVVAGDISFDIEATYEFLLDLSKHYEHVIFVDGNHEHNNETNFYDRTVELKKRFKKYQNVRVLARSAFIIGNVAFIGANGWWTYDFIGPESTDEDPLTYFLNSDEFTEEYLLEVSDAAKADADCISILVERLSREKMVEEIVIITHTSPLSDFVVKTADQHPAHYSRCGNSYLENAIDNDVNCKVTTWCFGHVHKELDEIRDGIRYLCHPRGRSDDSPHNAIYYPKRIEL